MENEPLTTMPSSKPSSETMHNHLDPPVDEDPILLTSLTSSSSRDRSSWIKRYFTAMQEGSLRGSIFVLVNSALGAGMLTLPFAIMQAGIVVSSVLLVADALIAGYTSYILFTYITKYNYDSYSALCRSIIGPKAALVVDVIITLNGIGMCMAMCVFLGDFLLHVAMAVHAHGILQNRTFLIGVSVLIMWPMSVQPLMGRLKWLSFAILAGLGIICIIIVAKTPALYAISSQSYQLKLWSFNLSFGSSYNMFLFSFSQHMNCCVVAKELANPTRPRCRKVAKRAGIIELLFYSTLGLSGYISWLDAVEQNFINNYDSDDIAILICRLFLSIMLLVSVPINIIASCKSCNVMIENIKSFVATRRTQRQSAPLLHDTHDTSFTAMNNIEATDDMNQTHTAVPASILSTEVVNGVTDDSSENAEETSYVYTALLYPDDAVHESKLVRIIFVTIVLSLGFVVSSITDRVATVASLVGGLFSSTLIGFFPSLLYFMGPMSSNDNAFKRHSLFSIIMGSALLGYVSTVIIILQTFNAIPAE